MVVAYVRLSVEDQGKISRLEASQSIKHQLDIIRDYAKKYGYIIEKEYIDDGYSGIYFDRPAFDELLNDIEAGLVSMVITKDISRLGREFIDTTYYASIYFPKFNVRYIAVDEGYDNEDCDNPVNEGMFMFRTIVNESYVAQTSKKRKATSNLKTMQNNFIGFQAPYGYKKVKIEDKTTLVIDIEAAKIVKRIFNEIAEGKSREEVAKSLNDDKVQSPMKYLGMTPNKNKKYYYDWTGSIIYTIIRDRVYNGNLVVRKSSKQSYKQKKRECIPYDKRQIKEKTHPAIIDDKLFKAANSKIRKISRGEKSNYTGPFIDLVYCGECGNIIKAGKRKLDTGNDYYTFECSKRIERVECPNGAVAENKIKNICLFALSELFDVYVDDDEIIDITTKSVMQKEKYKSKISVLEYEIDVINSNIKRLYMKKTKGEITLNDFVKAKKEESESREIKAKELNELKEQNNRIVKREEIKKLYDEFKNSDSLFPLLKDFIKSIVLYKDKTVQINFNFGIGKPKRYKIF